MQNLISEIGDGQTSLKKKKKKKGEGGLLSLRATVKLVIPALTASSGKQKEGEIVWKQAGLQLGSHGRNLDVWRVAFSLLRTLKY